MADLIAQDTCSWKVQVIDNSFLPFEAQQIKAIPLCALSQPDFLYWALEKNGVYLVKSGYKLICEEARIEKASGSTRIGVAGLWSRIWKLKVPGKIKHFLWRACSNYFPTKVNLMKRKILAELLCHLCGNFPWG